MKRTRRFVARSTSALALTLAFSALPSVPNAFADGGGEGGFNELSGLPPRPKSSTIAVDDLLKLAEDYGKFRSGKKGHELFSLSDLLHKYKSSNPFATIKVVESYSKKWPVVLKGKKVYVPKPDGIRDLTQPRAPAQISEADCQDSGTYTCVDLQPATKDFMDQVTATIIVGWNVELAGDVTTDGRGLIIVADSFKANGHSIITTPLERWGTAPLKDTPGNVASNGRDGRDAGDVMLFAAEFDGIHVEAEGQSGEKGLDGLDFVGDPAVAHWMWNYEFTPPSALNISAWCVGTTFSEPQSGGKGGNAGRGGSVYTYYSVLRGIGKERDLWKTKEIRDKDCIGKCSDFNCSQNPSIAACDYTTEANNDTCSDGKDNDKDGYKDCNDFNCSKNPFVTVCPNAYKYKEASPEACTDGMGDDCGGVSCKHRQICGAPEGDPGFAYSGNSPIANSSQSRDFNGNYRESDASFGLGSSLRGLGGNAGKRNTATKKVTPADQVCVWELKKNPVGGIFGGGSGGNLPDGPGSGGNLPDGPGSGSNLPEYPPQPASDYELVCHSPTRDIEKSCVFPGPPRGTDPDGCSLSTHHGENEDDIAIGLCYGDDGKDGEPGTHETRWINRRQIDTLRALLSPNQWTVGTALANASVKQFTKETLETAGILYLDDLMRMHGIFESRGLTCQAVDSIAPPPPNGPVSVYRPLGDRVLQATICPAAGRNLQHLANLASGLNFYGQPQNPPIDPHNRFAVQYAGLAKRLLTEDARITKFQALANAIDTSQILSFKLDDYTNLAVSLSADLTVAQAKEAAARQERSGIQGKIDARKVQMAKNTAAIITDNQKIAAKYSAGAGGGLGALLTDLMVGVASAYGGPIAGKAAEAMLGQLSGAFSSVSPISGDADEEAKTKNMSQTDAGAFLDGVWAASKDCAKKAVASAPVQAKAEAAGVGLLNDILSNQSTSTPQRSVIVDEVEVLLLNQEQKALAMDTLDLAFDYRNAQAKYEIATMERQVVELRQAQAIQMAQKVEAYQQDTTLLRGYDKMLLAQSIRTAALGIFDGLIRDYWKLLRQAEYEKTAYNENGVSWLSQWTSGSYDYNFSNIEDFRDKVDALSTEMYHVPHGAVSSIYRKIQTTDIHIASDTETSHLISLGLGIPHDITPSQPPYIATTTVTKEDLNSLLFFKSGKNAKIDDIRVSILTTQNSHVVVFVIKDTFDTFRVAYNAQTNTDYYKEFLLASTSTIGGPIHYGRLVSCSRPPPTCDFSKDGCNGWLESDPTGDYACSIYGGPPKASSDVPSLWELNPFYDRSPLGNWTIVIPASQMPPPSTISGIELSLVAASPIL